MKDILIKENLKILESCSSTNTVFGFDFDGTLAPIVADPDKAKMSDTTRDLLTQLNETATVAIITGRSIQDVKRLLSFTPKYLVGNHGLEGILDEAILKEIKAKMATLKDTLTSTFKDDLIEYGIYVEDKIYSLSLHYRLPQRMPEAEKRLEEFFLSYSSARLVKGKMVLNVVPDVDADKGIAFLKILNLENAKFGFYIGDDVTDEDVFLCGDSRIIGVNVGDVKSSHAPYFIKHQSDVNKLLDILIKITKSSKS